VSASAVPSQFNESGSTSSTIESEMSSFVVPSAIYIQNNVGGHLSDGPFYENIDFHNNQRIKKNEHGNLKITLKREK